MLRLLSLVLIILFQNNTYSSDNFYPANIFLLDQRFSHHVVIVEKSTHMLYIYQNDMGQPKLLKSYQIATGKVKGNKQIQGDKKTPEGIYQFRRFHSANYLTNLYGKTGLIYGAGAFTMTYPNEIDKRRGKTGGGIWLHSTDDDARVSKGLDSRGCVVATDKDLKDISQFIELTNTPVIIVQNMNFMSKKSWTTEKSEITELINTWSTAWQNKDFTNYINSYSKNEFMHKIRGNYNQYRRYKKAVFSRKDSPAIDIKNVSILSTSQYAVVTLEQDYKSEVIQDIGKKVLYLKKNANYEWKIVAEKWSKLGENQNLSFTPKMRYFNDQVTKKDTENDTGSI